MKRKAIVCGLESNKKPRISRISTALGPILRFALYRAIRLHLSPFLHADVIPIVQAYASIMTFSYLRVVPLVDSKNEGKGKLDHPSSICLHEDEIYVADTNNHQIQVFHQSTGRFVRKVQGNLIHPIGIAIHGALRRVFVSDRATDQIKVYRLDDWGLLSVWDATAAAVPFFYPFGITICENQVLVVDCQNHRIAIFSPDGKLIRSFGSLANFYSPAKLAKDPFGHELFVADGENHRIQCFDMNTFAFLRQYGSGVKGRRQGQLNHPYACALHGDELIVCDTFNDRLVVFDRFEASVQRMCESYTSDDFHLSTFRTVCDVQINDRNELFACNYGNDRILVFN